MEMEMEKKEEEEGKTKRTSLSSISENYQSENENENEKEKESQRAKQILKLEEESSSLTSKEDYMYPSESKRYRTNDDEQSSTSQSILRQNILKVPQIVIESLPPPLSTSSINLLDNSLSENSAHDNELNETQQQASYTSKRKREASQSSAKQSKFDIPTTAGSIDLNVNEVDANGNLVQSVNLNSTIDSHSADSANQSPNSSDKVKTKTNAKKANNKNKDNEQIAEEKTYVMDPSDERYWQQIYDTRYYQENSLKFKDLMNRELGFSSRMGHGTRTTLVDECKPRKFYDNKIQTARHFVNKANSSLSFVRRMKLTHSLNHHDGCVNSLNFNRIGTLLASGSDDYQVCVWDWANPGLILSFDSGHKSNVFQSKFMPYTGDTQIVTCARDGQVRLALISSSGSLIGTKKLAKHADSCHKLSIEYDSSNMFLSCGEDGVVYEIDLRQKSPAKILTVKSEIRNQRVPLYSISSNPLDTFQFVVSGKDQFLRIYDKRMLVNEANKVLRELCPLKLKESNRASVTSAVYNNDGNEILASYSDEDIYLFDLNNQDNNQAKFNYKGHKNSDTIKGVNFFGSNSDYVVSGSDCGRIFFWEKTTQQIVQILKGDERGIVNVLEPHPIFPILATSGLDSDVKIWSPLSEEYNNLENLTEIINENQQSRDSSRHFSLSSFEFELLLMLMHRPQTRVFDSLRVRTNFPYRFQYVGDDENDDDEEEEEEEDATNEAYLDYLRHVEDDDEEEDEDEDYEDEYDDDDGEDEVENDDDYEEDHFMHDEEDDTDYDDGEEEDEDEDENENENENDADHD